MKNFSFTSKYILLFALFLMNASWISAQLKIYVNTDLEGISRGFQLYTNTRKRLA